MRILFVSSLYEPNLIGGAERVVQALAEGLAAQGHKCVVATLGRGLVKDTRFINGVKVHYIPLRNLYWPFQSFRPSSWRKAAWHVLDSYNPAMGSALGEIIEEEKPEVVNSHNIAGFSVAIWKEIKRRKLPLVHTLHDQYLLCPNTTMFRDGKNCTKQCTLCKWYSKPRKARTHMPDIVTGVSRFILDRHRQYGLFPGVKEAVIYNAYERQQDLPPVHKTKNSDRTIRFGFLGRLHPSKGIEHLLKAYLKIPAGKAELWIGGQGDEAYEADLKAKSTERSDVKWLGFVQAESLLTEVDVIVIPSLWHDTAPLVALEAMAWGLPIIASRRGGLPELVQDGLGWIFEPNEPDSLTRVFDSCLNNKDGLAEKKTGALVYAQRFSKQAMVTGYLSNYERVLRV